LKSQITRREICDDLRLGSDHTARTYADKIISVDAIERRRISTDLRLNALLIDVPNNLVNVLS
jgi:hypothetical protein